MRILQLHTHYRQAGGEDRAVDTEAMLLRHAGHDVRTYGMHNPDGLDAAIPFALAPWNPAAARRVARAVERWQPDVAHVHNTWYAMSPSVLPVLKAAGVPVVMTLHNYRTICSAATLFRDGAPCTDCVGTHPGHAIRHRCYRSSALQSTVAAASIAVQQRRGTWRRDVDRYLALTEFGRQQFISGGFPPHLIDVKSNSVPDPGQRVLPPSSSRSILFVGRLSEEKGVEVLLDAWGRRTRDLELVVVGTGPLESRLRAQASGGVRFLGLQTADAVASMMLTARALVFPSVCYEGQGLVALEAAAAGLPVITSDLGAMAGLFAPHGRKLLFPPADAEALSQRLDAAEHGTLVDGEGAIARACFEDRYSHEVALTKLEDTYQTLVRRP